MCDPLIKAVESKNHSRFKGIKFINLGTLGTEITLISGDFKKPGIVLNYCPFCGGHLRDLSNNGEV